LLLFYLGDGATEPLGTALVSQARANFQVPTQWNMHQAGQGDGFLTAGDGQEHQ